MGAPVVWSMSGSLLLSRMRPLLLTVNVYSPVSAELIRSDHHTAPGEGMAQVGHPRCGIAAYWNNSGEVMLFLVNLSEESETTSWQIDLPCGSSSGEETLEPLSLKAVKFTISR